MKRKIMLLAAALMACVASAADITESEARTVASNFVAKNAMGLKALAGRTVDTVTQRGGLWLVTLKPSGHLFVSANRAAEPIPAFSEHDFAEPSAGSPDAAVMANVEANVAAATGSAHESEWRTLLGIKTLRLSATSSFDAQNVGPLLPTTWNQCAPYTDFAPVNPATGSHMPNGCVAVAYSQIMRYWGWPEKVEEDWSFSHMADSTPGFVQQMKAGTEIDWSAMLGDYVTGMSQVTKSNTLQLGLGQILTSIITEMKFRKEASGAELSRYSQNPWFTLPRSINNLSDDDGTYEQRYQLARESIVRKIPMMIGVTVKSGSASMAHAIVGDGWMETTETDGKIHLNYGWGGGSNDKWVSFASSGVETFMLDCVPRPMVIAEPTPAEAALPLKVSWLFPKKGHEDTLDGFTVSYAEVTDATGEFTDDFAATKGVVRGSHMSVRTLSGCNEDSELLAIGTDVNVDRNTFTWPSVFVGTGAELSFRYRSDHALNMSVLVEAFDANASWQLLKKLELNETDASDWRNVTIGLADYANKSVAFRVRATRPSAKAANYSGSDCFGVQIDDWKVSKVHTLQAAKTVAVDASARAYTFGEGALDAGKTYVFTVTPDVAGGEAGLSTCAKIVASPADRARIWGVQSIHAGDSQFEDGVYRECFLGTNQFAVYASATTTDLRAHLSHLALMDQTKVLDAIDNTTWLTISTNVSVANAMKVEKAADGKFLVTLDFSHLTAAAKGANEMVTLEAADALGNIDRKNVMLHFSKVGNETAITKDQLPEYGGTIPGGNDDDEEEETVYCTVSFSAMGGTDVAKRTVEKGEPVGDLPTTSREGYTLDGWFTEITGGTKITAATPVTGDVIYFAQWTKVEEEEPEEPGGDDPVVDPADGDPNDFTDGGVSYRFCNGVDKSSGFFDVNRVGTLTYQIPAAYDLVLWWAENYKKAVGSYPAGYSAPSTSSLANDGYPFSLSARASQLFTDLMSGALPTAAEREKYFPAASYSAADWYGTGAQDTWAKETGKKIYAYLAQGPIGILAATSSSRAYGGVVWGCECGDDGDGKYAKVLYITSTRLSNDNTTLERMSLGVCTVSGVGTMPGLLNYNSGNPGALTTFYPIAGPAASAGGGETPEDPEPEDPEPDTPSEDGKVGVADNANDPGKDYTPDYGYEMYDNYWTARKRAIQQGKQLFILSGAAWCSNCAFVKNYLKSLGEDFSGKFVVYYSDNDSTSCNCFRGGLPQYGAADPRTVDAFTGTLNGSVRSWDVAWQTSTSGIYKQERGGYAPERVALVVNAGKEMDALGKATNLVIRGLATLGTGTIGRYELYAQFDDGVEMPVDYGVDWEVAGDGKVSDANVDGRDVAALTVASGSVQLKATSTFYFTGTKTITVECAPESEIASVEIVTGEVNLEDNLTPTIEAVATLNSGKTMPVFGFGKWTAAFNRQLPRADADLEESSAAALSPSITIDSASQLNYALGDSGLVEVCDQVIDVSLTVNGKTAKKQITVWGPTKVVPSKWRMVSGPKQTMLGVVRLQCTELKYNYGGKIYTTADTYFASYETVLKSGTIFTQTSRLRGLTAYIDNSSSDKEYAVGLRATKVNGKYKGYLPANPESSPLATNVTCLTRGSDVTTLEKGLVPQGFFRAFFPNENSSGYATLAETDSDGDGFKNWEEYVLGTDPTNAGDALTLMQGYQHLSAPAAKGSTMQYKVMYQQRARRIYYIDAKAAWGDAWRHVATVSLANMDESDVTTFTDLDADYADAAQFFRVRASLYDHVFSDPDNAPVIEPKMLVANRGAVIDLTSEALPLALSSFDTDATDPGTVWVQVPADVTKGTVLMTAPAAAEKSLQACKPKDRTDITFEVVAQDGKLALRVAGEEPVVYEGPFAAELSQDVAWSEIVWTDANGRRANWETLGQADASVTIAAAVPVTVEMDAAPSLATIAAGANVTLAFSGAWPTAYATALQKSVWQGVVKLTGALTSGVNIGQFGNAGSKIVWAASLPSNGYLANGTAWAGALEIPAGQTLKIANGYTNGKYVFSGALLGEGTFETSANIPAYSVETYCFTGDVSGFRGRFVVGGHHAVVLGDQSPSGDTGLRGKLLVLADHTATLANGTTWSAANGMVVSGTLNVTGAGDAAAVMVLSSGGLTIDGTLQKDGVALAADEYSVLGGTVTFVAKPSVEGGDDKAALTVEPDRVIVRPQDGVRELTVRDIGDRNVVIPPELDALNGVTDKSRIVIRAEFGTGKSVDLTPLMKLTQTATGYVIALDETTAGQTVSVDGEDIPVTPTLAAAEEPFAVGDGGVSLGVKTIPGLKYQVMRCATPNGKFEAVGDPQTATDARLTLEAERTADASLFYTIRVSK